MTKLMKYYEELENFRREYDAATSEEEREVLRARAHEWGDRITKEGAGFARLYRMYESAMDRGNDAIDISEVIWDRDFEPLMNEIRANGITRFTFSSTWSSAVETAWKFMQLGWKLAGMTEINGSTREIMSDEYQKVPAYVFEI